MRNRILISAIPSGIRRPIPSPTSIILLFWIEGVVVDLFVGQALEAHVVPTVFCAFADILKKLVLVTIFFSGAVKPSLEILRKKVSSSERSKLWIE